MIDSMYKVYIYCKDLGAATINHIDNKGISDMKTTIQVKVSAKLLQINGDERPKNGRLMSN